MPNPEKCAFCGRPKNEVKQLIVSHDGVGICGKCIAVAVTTLDTSAKGVTPEAKEEPLRKPKEIKAYLDEHIVGQERAKTDISVAIYNHFKRRVALQNGLNAHNGIEIQKSNVLLLGPSGSGKTEIARSIARLLKVPFYVADATRLTQAGYVGDDVESLLQGLLADADGDIERAEWGIVFLDEFDKLARKSGRSVSGYRDVSGEGVQQSLLKMIEGGRVAIPRGAKGTAGGQIADLIDTKNVLFICAGSFAGIEESVNNRLNKDNRVGFGAGASKKQDTKTVYEQVIEEDILDFGLIPELVGRIPVMTTTLPLTEEEMVRILTEPKNALVKQYQALFSMDGVKLTFDPAALQAIGRKAKERPTGARALRGILEDLLRSYAYSIPSETDVREILVTELAVNGADAVVRRGPPEPPLEEQPLLTVAKG